MLKTKIAFSIMLMVSAASAMAGTSDIKASNNELGISYINTNVTYSETGNGTVGPSGTTLDTESGGVGGIELNLSEMRNIWLGNDYFNVAYSHSSGSTNYVGAIQGGNYGQRVSTSGAIINDISARYGKGFAVNSQWMLTPYVQVGHHEWNRGVNYGEDYTNYTYGVGGMAQYSPVAKLVLSANALVGYTANAGVYVNGFGNAALGNSPLYQLGFNADYAFTAHIHGTAGVDCEQFQYGASSRNSAASSGIMYAEPNSATQYTTAKIGVAYSF